MSMCLPPSVRNIAEVCTENDPFVIVIMMIAQESGLHTVQSYSFVLEKNVLSCRFMNELFV